MTTEHHPLCDDNGWDHPGPCAIETDAAYETDNRYSPGSSGANPPIGSPAAYSARWIDQGDLVPADIVPDRQGFAYNDEANRDTLITALNDNDRRIPGSMPRDRSCLVVRSPQFTMAQRRSGGYIYVDAWLQP